MSTIFIAHRGYSGKYRENTAEAFEMAVRAGFGGIETDVRRTKDGVLVCCHNSEASYADGTVMEVAEHTFADLTAKPLYNPFTDTDLRLCSFEEYLRICHEGNVIAVIELKGTYTPEQIDQVFDMADAIHGLSRCQLQSFHEENLEKAHERFPALTVVYTCGGHEEYLEQCLKKGFMIAADQGGLTRETVDRFHEAGIMVDVWTVNRVDDLKRAREMRCDLIESDLFSSFAPLEE